MSAVEAKPPAPATMEDAQRRRGELAVLVQEIQAQMGDRNRLVDGRRMTDHEYWQWRSRAATALRHRTAELRELNAWIKARNRETTASLPQPTDRPGYNAADAGSLIYACWVLLGDMARDGVTLDAYEQGLRDALREYARNHGGGP